VDKVAVTDKEIQGTLKPGALPAPAPRPGDRVRSFFGAEPGPTVFRTTRIPGVDDSSLVKELEAHKVEFAGRIENTFWRDLLFGWVLPLAVMAASGSSSCGASAASPPRPGPSGGRRPRTATRARSTPP